MEKNIFDVLIKNYDLSQFYQVMDKLKKIRLSHDELIYQYTTWNSLFNGIIRPSESDEKKVHLWSTNCKYLNDPNEINKGEAIVDVILKRLFETQWSFHDDEHLNSYFISSFCSYKNKNSLPMWNLYGANGDGLSIGFKYSYFAGPEFTKGHCIYTSPQTWNEIISSIEYAKTHKPTKTPNGDKFSLYLYELMSLGKDVCYEYEDEIRVITNSSDSPNYRMSGNLIIPYMESVFPKDAIQEIIIGPCNDYERSEASLKFWLKNARMEHVKVVYSNLPFRNK